MIETPYNSVNDERLQSLLHWLNSKGIDFDHLTVASADAGFRRYFRLHNQNSSLIAVDAPPEYEDTAAFIAIANSLRNSGLRPPTIHCYSSEKGFLLIEDFGDRHLQQSLEQNQTDGTLPNHLYQQAMTSIERMQKHTDTTLLPVCDSAFLRAELELFPTWYLNTHRDIHLDSEQREILNNTFDTLTWSATAQPYRFMHRDYHCRNLMVSDQDTLGLIDFQGAMLGPVTYDPVSLLKDVYIDLSADFQQQLMERHRATLTPEIVPQTYQRWFDLMGLQRHLKILGIFSRLKHRDNKPHYLSHLPTVISHIEKTLANYAELSEFYALFKQLHTGNHLT